MEKELTQEQSVMRETARLFALKSLSPRVEEFDAMDAPYPDGWMDKAAELGFITMLAPPEIGGVGAGVFDAGIVLEELAAGSAGMAAGVVSGIMGVMAALNSGAPRDIIEKLLATPEASDQAGFRSSVAGLFMTDFTVGEDGTIGGGEACVLGADKANWTAVIAREGEGNSCWIVRKDMEGVDIEPMRNTLGLRAAAPARLTLNSVEGDRMGACDADKLLAAGSALIGCVAVGCARAALGNALDYARERYQGGGMIVKHDAVAHMILSNRARIEAARSHLWKVLGDIDKCIDPETGALKGKVDVNEAVLARVFAMDASLQATLDAVQCHGGYGYMHDFPVERRLRDARSLGVVFGTNPELMSYIKPSLLED